MGEGNKMIFKNYEYFIAIAEEESISRAAERLYISQPSLSKYLKRLEDNIGEELFCRVSYPLRLTKAGELYLTYVKEIANRERYLLEEFSNIKHTESGTIAIGITVWRSSIFLPVILPAFKQRYPRIQVTVYEGTHQQMAAWLESGKTDFSIFHLPNIYNHFTFEHLRYERILFCVNQENPLLPLLHDCDCSAISQMTNEEFQLFSNESFILLKQGQNIRGITQNYLNKMRLNPQIILETSNLVTAINMVKVGMGVTFVPEAALSIQENHHDVCYFSIDHPPLQWEIGMAYKNDCPPKKQARLFIECMKELL